MTLWLFSSSLTGFFFFQAEDGIRDVAVTGVQTCALPISLRQRGALPRVRRQGQVVRRRQNQGRAGCETSGADFHRRGGDRKSTRLNSSHGYISYAVFCLKKKKKKKEVCEVCENNHDRQDQ